MLRLLLALMSDTRGSDQGHFPSLGLLVQLWGEEPRVLDRGWVLPSAAFSRPRPQYIQGQPSPLMTCLPLSFPLHAS